MAQWAPQRLTEQSSSQALWRWWDVKASLGTHAVPGGRTQARRDNNSVTVARLQLNWEKKGVSPITRNRTSRELKLSAGTFREHVLCCVHTDGNSLRALGNNQCSKWPPADSPSWWESQNLSDLVPLRTRPDRLMDELYNRIIFMWKYAYTKKIKEWNSNNNVMTHLISYRQHSRSFTIFCIIFNENLKPIQHSNPTPFNLSYKFHARVHRCEKFGLE